MIPQIKELNFPKLLDGEQYATLEKATVTLNDMGERTIATEVSINGDIQPDFSYDWEVEFKGEKYIMPLRKPQASKSNDTRSSKINLTFQHWAQYQLKRWYFFTLPSENANVAVADKYEASVSLNLGDFVNYFNKILEHYYGDKIKLDLNPNHEYNPEPVFVDINYSYLWNVLIKLYELYAVRWEIALNPDFQGKPEANEHYVIKIGYDAQELDHIFEYGFKGGLLKVERQVQDENIRNVLLGRGGEKNIPYRYFKCFDPQNPTFRADPDWVHELANTYFDRIRSAEFRSYVQGWKAAHSEEYTDEKGDLQKDSRILGPTSAVDYWAYMKGSTDKEFSPIEYVTDEIYGMGKNEENRQVEFTPSYSPFVRLGSSIDKYGPLVGSLESNEEIYPSIQGVERGKLGRIDEVIAVEQVTNNAPEITDAIKPDATVVDVIKFGKVIAPKFEDIKPGAQNQKEYTIDVGRFTVPQGRYGNADPGEITFSVSYDNFEETVKNDPALQQSLNIGKNLHKVSNALPYAVYGDGTEIPAQSVPAGTYTLRIKITLENTDPNPNNTVLAKLISEGASVDIVTYDYEALKNSDRTFNVWIKNVWETEPDAGEDPVDYAHRVWDDILGNHLGEDAAVVFSTGWLSTSEDYEFRLVKGAFPVYDTSRTLVKEGEPSYRSHWRLTLERSNADYDTLGKFVPNLERQGNAGDKFFFVGINLTQDYVDWAEERLRNYKLDQLEKVKEIIPSWSVSLDKVRIGEPKYDDTVALIDQLKIGSSIRLYDKRFITPNDEIIETNGEAYVTLYLQAITYKYNDGNSANITPTVEVTLGNEYVTSANPVTAIQGQIDSISRQLGATSVSGIQQVVRMVGDKIYLRKDGITDRSLSKTYFTDLLASLGFTQGMIGGQGWGFFKDENGRWVLETDRLNVREDFQVNNLVINQIEARGGMIIESAASMKISFVEYIGSGYKCYFDTQNGSVRNLFKVGDVAYCHRFNPEDTEDKTLKIYKRRVMDVGIDYVELSNDTDLKYPRTGTGIPTEGDVIVQYGSYTDSRRRFVIERDVIDGGYERMISGLTTVNSQGTEYYFAGRQSPTGERFFVGNRTSGNYIEYKDGKLTIPGQLILAPDGNNTMLDFIEGLISESKSESEKYADAVVKAVGDDLQNQIDGAIETWYGAGAPTLSNYPTSEWKKEDYQKHVGDLYYDKELGYAYRFMQDGGDYTWVLIQDTDIAKALATANSKRRIFTDTPYTPYDVGDLWVNATYGSYNNDILRCKTSRANGAFTIGDWELASKYTDDTKANEALDEIAGYEYLKEALEDGRTEASNGLILTSLIQLGTWSGTQQKVWSGINGLYSTYGEKGIAAWYGGDMLDIENPLQLPVPSNPSYAQSLFRFDGSGYLAGGNIGWDKSGGGYLAGKHITWDASGNLTLNNGLRIEGGTEGVTGTIESIVNTLNMFTQNFQPVYNKAGDTCTWSEINGGTRTLYAVKSRVGFFSDSFISAMGMNDNSGEGGGGNNILYLSELFDVNVSNPQEGQMLAWNGKAWTNTNAPRQIEIEQSVTTSTTKVPSSNAVKNAIEDAQIEITQSVTTATNSVPSNNAVKTAIENAPDKTPIEQSVTNATDKVPSSNAVLNAIANRMEGVIVYGQVKQYLEANYDTLRNISSPHVFQLISGVRNVGVLMVIGDSSSTTLNLLLFTRQNVSGTEIQNTFGGEAKLYRGSYVFATDFMSDWEEIGTGGGSDGDGDANVAGLKYWLGLEGDDARNWYDGFTLSAILNNLRSLLGSDNWNTTSFEGENIKTWLNVLSLWVGEPSLDAGDWEEGSLYAQMQRIVIPVDKVLYGNVTDSGTIDKSAWEENGRYQVYLNMSDNKIYLRDVGAGRSYSKWNGYERWKPSNGEYYDKGVYVCFNEAQVVVYDRTYGGLRIIAGSMFMKGLSHESPTHTHLNQLSIPYMDEEAATADTLVMSVEELKNLISGGASTNDNSVIIDAPSDLLVPNPEYFSGKAVRNEASGNIGFVKVFSVGGYTTIMLETMLLMSGDIFINADPNTLRTYYCKCDLDGTWGSWTLLKEEQLP